MFKKATDKDSAKLTTFLKDYFFEQWKTQDVRYIKNFLKDPTLRHFCLDEGKELKGYACLSVIGQHHAVILHFLLSGDDFTLGTELLDGTLRWCETEGLSFVDAVSIDKYRYLFTARGFRVPLRKSYLSRTLGKQEQQVDLADSLAKIQEIEDVMEKTRDSLKKLSEDFS